MERLTDSPGARTIKSDPLGLYFDAIPEVEQIIISCDEHCLAVFGMNELVDADIFYEEQLYTLKNKNTATRRI